MVSFKQLSLTAAVALSIAETAVALPIRSSGNDADLAARETESVAKRAFHKNLFNNSFKALNLGNAIAGIVMSERDNEERAVEEEVEERDFEEDLEERDFEEELEERDYYEEELEARDYEDYLDERDFDDYLEERDFDDFLEERDFDDYLYERDFEDYLEERALEERARISPNIGENIGNGLDAAYTIATTYGTIKNAIKSMGGGGEGKRGLEELERRAFEDLVRELYY
ncbi:unnamed protein product [Clonostachys byssicola]|uniref:Uncharacterized protein n=1 Tax=Clonostachys byssicola TaxID=160290 RepID=A0A9N9TY97_9HYPO|nr:unnamed protein product [Clonostachys byssicola]